MEKFITANIKIESFHKVLVDEKWEEETPLYIYLIDGDLWLVSPCIVEKYNLSDTSIEVAKVVITKKTAEQIGVEIDSSN